MWRRRGGLLGAIALLLAALALLPGLVSAQATFGVNWAGTFFNSTNFTGPIAAFENYPNGLNFNWGAGKPLNASGVELAAVNADNFSVRFDSAQNFPTGGDYTFFGFVDDQIRIFVDGVEAFNTGVPGNYSFVRNVAAGTHTLRVEYVEISSTAIIQFQWQLGATPGVPGVATGTPAPSGPIANVVFVRGLSLRTGPYLGASFIAVLRPDNQYFVSGKNTDEGGPYTWYRVTTGERTGWASGRYLTLNVDPATIPVVTSVFQEIDGAPDTSVIAIPRAIMNFRRRPSVRSQRLGQIPWGAEVQLLGRTIQAGKNHWFQVRYNGQVGWIFAPYVGWRGNIDFVPVR